MKKIGKEVCFLQTGEGNPRNGEGTFIRLKDGSILYAFTEYCGYSWEDHAVARISGCKSTDEGETWSDRFILFEKDKAAQNIMSTNLIRMNNGDLGMIYLRKEKMPDNGYVCMPVIRRSTDEGVSWSDWKFCTQNEGYYCPFNGSALVLRNGRILMPVSFHGHRADLDNNCLIDPEIPENGPVIKILYSDDDGTTWDEFPQIFSSPYPEPADLVSGFAEPGIYEHEDGTLWIWFRTSYGFQYQSVSKDEGLTWTPVMPSFYFTSPDAPMTVHRCGKYTVAIHNPVPWYSGNERREVWNSPKRTPLVCTVSTKDGRDFSENCHRFRNGGMTDLENNMYYLEDNPENSYCYPSVFAGEDYFLISYYHSNGSEVCLNCSKILKVSYTEISEQTINPQEEFS